MIHLIQKAEGFDWDSGNIEKINFKHNVLPSEAEQVFFNEPLLLMDDIKHSQKESRYHALGVTDDLRLLHVTLNFRSKGAIADHDRANAHVQAPKYAGGAFASFAKGMTAYFGRLETVCYARRPDWAFVSLHGRMFLSCSAKAASATSVSKAA